MVWFIAAAIMGLGMALLYSNLIASMADRAPPSWRDKALGTYRYWRDTGSAVGALLLGAVAQWSGATGPVGHGCTYRFIRSGDRAWIVRNETSPENLLQYVIQHIRTEVE